LCDGYKNFFTHVDQPMRLMASLLKQGRYADEVMGILAREGNTEAETTGTSDESTGEPQKTRRSRRRKK
jgi:uncharacterized protein